MSHKHIEEDTLSICILGCGPSGGTPYVGCKCKTCMSLNPKNRRTRSSIFIKSESQDVVTKEKIETNILVDTGPDLKEHFLKLFGHETPSLDAIMITHAHYDHIGGAPEMYNINKVLNKQIPTFSNLETLREIEKAYPYLFSTAKYRPDYKPILEAREFDLVTQVGSISVRVYDQRHGSIKSLGIIFNEKIVYSTDVSSIDDASFEMLSAIKPIVWIVGCIGYEDRFAHAGFSTIRQWNKMVKPQIMILTHMSHDLEYEEFCKHIVDVGESSIIPGYDSMKITVKNNQFSISKTEPLLMSI